MKYLVAGGAVVAVGAAVLTYHGHVVEAVAVTSAWFVVAAAVRRLQRHA